MPYGWCPQWQSYSDITLASIGSNGVAGASLTAKSASGLANAKLPPGMCPGSNLPVTLSDGHGTSSANPDSTSYFYISINSGPVTLDVNHDGIKDTAAVFECNDGGTAYTTGLWIFDLKASGFKVLATRTHAPLVQGIGVRKSNRWRSAAPI